MQYSPYLDSVSRTLKYHPLRDFDRGILGFSDIYASQKKAVLTRVKKWKGQRQVCGGRLKRVMNWYSEYEDPSLYSVGENPPLFEIQEDDISRENM